MYVSEFDTMKASPG